MADHRLPIPDSRRRALLSRRDWLRLGLTGAAALCLAPACQYAPKNGGSSAPGQPEPETVLSDGTTLYDDFDGHGNLQTFDGQNLAESGRLSSRIWNVWSGFGTGDVVGRSPAVGLFSVVDENLQRVEYRQEKSQEVEYIFDAGGNVIAAIPHAPGQPYHSSTRLIVSGARDGYFDGGDARAHVRKGKVYGVAQAMAAGPSGHVLKMTNFAPPGMSCELCNPGIVQFADNKSFSADVMVSSASTTWQFSVVLDIHATIPEQWPGKSWLSDIGIGTAADGSLWVTALCVNVNTGYRFFKYLGKAGLDTWYNLRQDIVTHKEDSTLREDEFRIDYYLDGGLAASEIPEDAALLLDPRRIGVGPKRILTLGNDRNDGTSVAFVDNVKAVYSDRVA
jgi:hypothetical protein